MGRKISLVLLIAFAGSLSILFGADRDIALIYLKTIGNMWTDDEEGAYRLIDDGLTYDESLSGLWFFKGLHEFGQDDFLRAERSLDSAWMNNDWDGGYFDRFLDLYFPLLSRLGRWEKILAAEDGVAFHRHNKKEILLACGWADFFTGRPEGAASRGRKGLDLYPGDWRFYPLALAGGEREWIPSLIHYWGDDDKVMGQIFQRLYKLDSLDPELYSWYRERDDRWGDFLKAEEALTRNPRNLTALTDYLNRWNPDSLYLIKRLSDLSGPSSEEAVDNYLLGEQGGFLYDGDGDTFPEIMLTEEKSLLADRDRDGLWDTRIALSGRKPVDWESIDNGEERSVKYRFYEWPFVEEVTRGRDRGSQLLRYLYPRFSLAEAQAFPEGAFRNGENPSLMELTGFILGHDLSVPWHILLGKSRRIEERKGEKLARLYYVVNGEVVAMEEDPDDLGYLSRQVLIEDGIITAARRDLDGDGVFDIFEYYDKGVWSGYAVNDGEGRSGFFEDWTFIPLKIWDYDRDSLMDGMIAGPYGEDVVTILPHRKDPRDVGDYLSWERKFEAQWYR